jgi:dipeptidase E
MKMLLTSAGITNNSLKNALQKLMAQPFEKANLVYIPTASNVEVGDKDWVLNDLNQFFNLGLACFDIVDISALPREIWLPRIESAQVIVVGGGNTFHLMHWLRLSGLDALLPKLLESRVYVGVSSGSMVISKSIFLTSDIPIFNENKFGEVDYTGLNFQNFYVRPHLNSPFFPQAREEVIAQSISEVTEPIYALDDQSAVLVDGDHVEVITEGIYRKFN